MAVAVVIDVAGALQSDCVLWQRGTLLRSRRTSGRLRYLVGVISRTAADWINHVRDYRHGSRTL